MKRSIFLIGEMVELLRQFIHVEVRSGPTYTERNDYFGREGEHN